MAKTCMLVLLLAGHSVWNSGAVVHQTEKRIESNFRARSNTTLVSAFSQSIWNNTITNLIQKEIEMTRTTPPKVNKLLYVVFAMIFGICGCDRCFMGQVLLGCVKGFTFGGLFIWHMIDYFVCIVSALSKSKEIDMMGYHAEFETSTIDGAFWLAVILLISQAISQVNQMRTLKAQRELQASQQAALLTALNERNTTQEAGREDLGVLKRQQSLAYIPTMLSKGLRQTGLVSEKPTIPELIAAFDTMDKNGDGQLDHDEVREGLKAMGASDETVDEMIKGADTDGDGKISKNEFLISMTQK